MMLRRLICGMDEAGRGPLAGPLVAAAIVAPEGYEFDARDSKKVTEKRREVWAEEFKATAHEQGLEYRIEIIDVHLINIYGIGWANKEIFRRLVMDLNADEYIIDGNHKVAPLVEDVEKRARTQSVVRADETNSLVSAASILAKTTRDQLMRELHETYPQYGWLKNKGYGTRQHISALKTFGGTPHHRNQFVNTVQAKVSYAQPLLLLQSGLMLALAFLSQGIPHFL
jgi:ribonuclease HII